MTEAQPKPEAKDPKRPYVAIFIRPGTRKQLAVAKVKGGFKSYDDLILHLLKQAGYADI
jgi:hypothetical protein